MNTLPFPDGLMAMLRAQSTSIAETIAQRMKAEVPSYAALPHEMLLNQNKQTVEYIAAMMNGSDFSVAREYFEQLTDTRIRAGIPTADFLQAMDLVVAAVNERIQHTYAADPEYRDKALRLFHAGDAFARNVAGRTQLRQVVEQTVPPRKQRPLR
ncbi:MAG: hypothetical protein M3Z04_12745 [Chloroflexota bacterium]|nr:hypothetical protein [Chloroflexota bacterium]